MQLRNDAQEWPTADFALPQLEHLDRDTVHIRCLQSTDFVLGRQTNFNGPVTIVNCSDVLKGTACLQQTTAPGGEPVLLREEVLSREAIRNIATGQLQHPPTPKHFPCPFCCCPSLRVRHAASLFLAAAVAAAIVTAVTFTFRAPSLSPSKPPPCNGFCIYSGFPWGGRASPTTEHPRLPASFLVISQTSHRYCYDHDACLRVVRHFQLEPTPQPPCNFLLGGDGGAYEDLGWCVFSTAEELAPHEFLRFCFMGNFTSDYPTYPQLQAAKALIRVALERGYLAEDYGLLGWRVSEPLRRVLKRWPRFRNESGVVAE